MTETVFLIMDAAEACGLGSRHGMMVDVVQTLVRVNACRDLRFPSWDQRQSMAHESIMTRFRIKHEAVSAAQSDTPELGGRCFGRVRNPADAGFTPREAAPGTRRLFGRCASAPVRELA